jgi:spermidine/putrescine transport system permease protein
MPTLEVHTAKSARTRRFARRDVRVGPLCLAFPALIGLGVFFATPFLIFFAYSFLTPGLFSVSGPLTVDAYGQALTSPTNATLARNSLIAGVAVGAISVAIGLPVAYWLRYSARRLQLPILFLITASMFASYLVRIYAWRTILGDSGVLNEALERLGLISHPLGFILFNRLAVIIALVHIALPFVILVLFAAFRPLEPRYLEAAQDLGAGTYKRWRRVIVPLMATPLVTTFLFTAILASADYVTPQFLGGTSGSLLGVRIQDAFKSTGDWPLGSALSVLMLAAYLLCFGVGALVLRIARLDRIRWTT